MDVDALAKTKDGKGKKGGIGTDKGGKSERFDGKCDWCGIYGHEQKDGWAKAAGKPKIPKSPRVPDLKPKCKGKGGKGKKRAPPLDEWPKDHNDQLSGEKSNDEV